MREDIQKKKQETIIKKNIKSCRKRMREIM